MHCPGMPVIADVGFATIILELVATSIGFAVVVGGWVASAMGMLTGRSRKELEDYALRGGFGVGLVESFVCVTICSRGSLMPIVTRNFYITLAIAALIFLVGGILFGQSSPGAQITVVAAFGVGLTLLHVLDERDRHRREQDSERSVNR